MKIRVLNIGSLNLKISPLLQEGGDLIRCVNVEKDQIGALKKRPGYITYLGTANGSAVVDLFSWTKDDGTTLFTYRNSGGLLYYSAQGTGAWSICGNGTMGTGHVGNAVLENSMIVGYQGGTSRYTTDGTSFTTITAAPKEEFFTSKFNRIWTGGTSSNMAYCTQGTISDWTSDSSSVKIPGAGKINPLWTCNDRVTVAKNSGIVFTYDDYNLRQVPTGEGPSSPYSLASTEDYWFYLNRKGFFGYGGDRPQLISNAIEKQIYNDNETGIAGSVFSTAPGGVYKYDYFCAVGTVKDDLTLEPVNDCIMKYDYQLDEWSNFKFYNFPTAFHTFKNSSGNDQFVFGDSTGQCFTYGGTALTDNGNPIESIVEGVLNFGNPEQDKSFNRLWALGNPGCNAKVQVASANSFNRESLKWQDVGDLHTGVRKFNFPKDSRGKLLFWRLYEYSQDQRFNFYGFVVDKDDIGE